MESFAMRVAIIDADLIGRKKHRFPNLACMKLSGYHKKLGDHVELLTDWQILGWDKVYVSKVFTDTEVPEEVLTAPNVQNESLSRVSEREHCQRLTTNRCCSVDVYNQTVEKDEISGTVTAEVGVPNHSGPKVMEVRVLIAE